MKTVYVITAGNPDSTRRFVDVKGCMQEATKLIEELEEGAKTIDVDIDYKILPKDL